MIFDEIHNIEKVWEDILSFEINVMFSMSI